MNKLRKLSYGGLLLLLIMIVIITVYSSNKNNGEGAEIGQFPTLEDDEWYKAEGKHFKVEGSNHSRIYQYYIYNSTGAIVEEGEVERIPPEITRISRDVLKICFHGGIFADLCKYYDTMQDVFSQEFFNPFIEHNGLIVYYDGEVNKLIIQDIFKKSEFYKEYLRDMSVTEPPVSIKFFDNNRKLSIVYKTKEQKEITEIFDLNI